MRNGAGLPAEHATCCGSFTNERQRRAHAFIRADIKVPTVYALLGHNKVRMRVQRISRLLRTHTVFFTMRISLSLSFSPPYVRLPSLPSSSLAVPSLFASLYLLDLRSVCYPPFLPLRFSLCFCVFLSSLSPTFSLTLSLSLCRCAILSLFWNVFRKASSSCKLSASVYLVLKHSRTSLCRFDFRLFFIKFFTFDCCSIEQ